jgi:flagella basal body P-ring formation protein FlgA
LKIVEEYLNEFLMIITATAVAALLAIGLTARASQDTGQTAQVRVRHEAQIAKSNVELGAIADISCTDEGIERALSTLILGEAPQTGKAVVWTAAEISKRLRPYSRFLQSTQLKLPDQIRIERVKNPILTRDELREQIEEALKATLPDPSWKIQVTDLDFKESLELPQGGSVQVVPPMTRPKGATSFQVLVTSSPGQGPGNDGQSVQRYWIAGRVKYTANVATVQRQIEARTRVSESDITWQNKDVTYIMDVPATTLDMSSAIARAALMPGTVLTRSMLEREMALHYGDEVEVNAGGGDLLVTTKGISQQNAFVGDTVKVRMNGSKFLSGVVTAKGIVQVRY